MNDIYKIGDKKQFEHKVTEADLAAFESGTVHHVYATFALGRDAEWCCRLFVLDMKEAHEEGIGTFLTIEHVSPALLGTVVRFEAEVIKLERNSIDCRYEAYVGERLIARGTQGQKIIRKEKLNRLFESLENE